MRFPEVHDGYDRLGMVYEARGDKEQAADYYKLDPAPVQSMPILVLEQAGLKKEEPTLTDLCVYLAGAALPMK